MNARLRRCLPHLLMLLVALALYAAASRIDSQSGRIGPDVWPKAVIVFMALLCVFEVARRLLSDDAPPPPEASSAQPAPGPEPSQPRLQWRPLLGGSAVIAGYVAGVSWLGFFVATALFVAGFCWVGGFRRPLWVALLGVGGSLLAMVLFMRVAYISLPLGEGPWRQLSIALLRLLGVT